MKKPKFFESFGLKLLAVLVSILLWLVVINVSDPVSSNTYSGITVTTVNSEAITTQGKVYEITDDNEVTITVSAKRSVLDSLGNENFKAIVDLGAYDDVTEMAPLRVESNKHSDVIESIKPKMDRVHVSVEDMMRKQFVIVPIVTGDPEEGYVIGDVSTAENIVRVSGAQSVVSTIKKVTAEVNVSGLSSSIATSVDLKLYDENDELIKDNNLVKNISTVAISAQLLATKQVGVKVVGVTGTPANGFCIANLPQADQKQIVIAAKSNVVAGINEIEIPTYAINIEGAKSDVETEIDITKYLPDGVSIPNGHEKNLEITVPIDVRQTKRMEVECSKVALLNLPDGFEGKIVAPEKISMDLSGSETDLNSLDEKDIKLEIDWEEFANEQNISSVNEGTYHVPVKITFSKQNTVVLEKSLSANIKLSEIANE